MEFLDRFKQADQTHLLSLGETTTLQPGELLVHQGQMGGDLFLVESGCLEVVDQRTRPAIILDTMNVGEIVGEMSFLAPGPRAADIRAGTSTTIRTWHHATLQTALEQNPTFGMRVYKALACLAADRVRTMTSTAVAGGFSRREGVHVNSALTHAASAIAGAAQSGWSIAEEMDRNNPDGSALQHMNEVFTELVLQAGEWLGTLSDTGDEVDAGALLRQKLRPFLRRARLTQLAAAQDSRLAGNHEMLAHTVLGEPIGEGALGKVIDEALLSLPTCRAIRQRPQQIADHLLPLARSQESQPSNHTDANESSKQNHIAMVGVGCGALLSRLIPIFSIRNTVFTCLDDTTAALGFMDAGLGVRPTKVQIVPKHFELARIGMGDAAPLNPPQDIIVVNGLVDYLPDRLVGNLVQWCRASLVPGGLLVATALAPSSDNTILDHLLCWPMIRRSPTSLTRRFASGGMTCKIIPLIAPHANPPDAPFGTQKNEKENPLILLEARPNRE